jgi:hypothetical protein
LKYLEEVELEELNCSILESLKVKQQESKNSEENSSFIRFARIFWGWVQAFTTRKLTYPNPKIYVQLERNYQFSNYLFLNRL